MEGWNFLVQWWNSLDTTSTVLMGILVLLLAGVIDIRSRLKLMSDTLEMIESNTRPD